MPQTNTVSLSRMFDNAFKILDTVDQVTSGCSYTTTGGTFGITNPTYTVGYGGFQPYQEFVNYDWNSLKNKKEIPEDLWQKLRRGFDSVNMIHSPTSFPYVNLFIDKQTKDMTIEMAIAGYKEDNINIIFEEDLLVVSGKGDKLSKEEREKYFEVKRSIKTSDFEVSFEIPFDKYDVEKSKASLKNGILKIEMPVKEDAKPKKMKLELT